MDVIIFGVGSTWKKEKNYLSKDMNIVGYMDNYANDSEIIRPGDLIKGGYSFDKILICVVFEHRFNMVNQLLDLGIPKEKIGFIEEFHKSYNYKTEIIDKGVIRINKNNIFIDCYNYLELMIATEVIVGNTYNYNTDEDYYVIDIGMNIGSASLFFAGQKNVKAVYGFEPGKYAYDRAISNFSLNPDIKNKIHPYNIALGKVDGTEEYFYHVGEDRAAGIKKVQENVLEELFDKLQTQTINIKQTSSFLENIIKKHNETAVLKMDCEGAEYGILEDLIESGMIDKIDVIMMEWHDG